MKAICCKTLSAFALAVTCVFTPLPTQADVLVDANLKERANAIVGLMSFMLTPDVTTGSLSLSNNQTGNPDIALDTLGGGFTMSQNIPLYLEGTLGYSRYDPTFLFSNGQAESRVSTKWESFSLTGGIGWDFLIAKELKLRPLFNFSYGRVHSNIAIASNIFKNQTGDDFEFLINGTLDVFGLGGSLILDYERYRDKNEIDVELRYTNITLQSFSDAPAVVQGSSVAQSLSLWTRWRAPTGLMALKKPVPHPFNDICISTGKISNERDIILFKVPEK